MFARNNSRGQSFRRCLDLSSRQKYRKTFEKVQFVGLVRVGSRNFRGLFVEASLAVSWNATSRIQDRRRNPSSRFVPRRSS